MSKFLRSGLAAPASWSKSHIRGAVFRNEIAEIFRRGTEMIKTHESCAAVVDSHAYGVAGDIVGAHQRPSHQVDRAWAHARARTHAFATTGGPLRRSRKRLSRVAHRAGSLRLAGGIRAIDRNREIHGDGAGGDDPRHLRR